jgi:hypothetical protein
MLSPFHDVITEFDCNTKVLSEERSTNTALSNFGYDQFSSISKQIYYSLIQTHYKGKAVPVQAWTGR